MSGQARAPKGHDADIAELARLVGIAESYADAYGNPADVPEATRRGLLEALGLPTASPDQARESLAHARALRRGPIPPLVVAPAGRAWRLHARGELPGATWTLALEDGSAREGKLGDTLMPALPAGYHRLEVRGTGGLHISSTVVAAPERCWAPEPLRKGERWWGVTAQLYGLRSGRDAGVGDYTAAGELAAGAAKRGASFLGLSPVHALFASDRSKISPYSPSSRLFLETLYINPEDVSPPKKPGRVAALKAGASPLKGLVDYEQAWAERRVALDALWNGGEGWLKDREFARFRQDGGHLLEAHATFEALSEHFKAHGLLWSGEWPGELHDCRSEAVRAFRAENEGRVAFHAWLQWLADRQLGDAAAAARDAGMALGLYRDLAVGPDRFGSEVWSAPDRYIPAYAVGAPPDLLGPQGQNWGLPAFNPVTLAEQGLAGFRSLVAANARHAGAIRIDHAFQLARLFLIPPGGTAAEGAYLEYPFEALLAALRIESHRAQCLVIAEDLGTAPEGFSEAIMASGVLSYRVFFFEEDETGFKPPQAYPQPAMAALSTHDLPTFAGWWRGLDVDLRETFGIYDAARAENDRQERLQERKRFSEALAREGLLPEGGPPARPPLGAACRFLARTPSALAALQVEDVALEMNQANMPGLVGGHPNWRRRSTLTVGELVAEDGALAELGRAMAQEGRGQGLGAAQAIPRATYRFQFHAGFTFDDALKVLPDLVQLGVSHVYASPIQNARPGSTHGYDIVDHGQINPELGGEAAFLRFSDALRRSGLGLVVDIVPNHMGIGKDNPLWRSMLAWGRMSPGAQAFDVDWDRPGADGKVLLPLLGQGYGAALESGELALVWDAARGGFGVAYYDEFLPISPLTWPVVLEAGASSLKAGSAERAALLGVLDGLRTLSREAREGEQVYERAALLAGGFVSRAEGSRPMRRAVDQALAAFNGSPGEPASYEALHRLLEEQNWRLAEWRLAASDLNYRRFFDVNALAGLRVEIPAVFDRAHALLVRFVREGRIQGLRIDHIDGLSDPEAYLGRLRRAVGPGVYIVAEKILEPGEELRPWPLSGTTGYDVMGLLDGVFLDPAAEASLDSLYAQVRADPRPPGEQLYSAKLELLETSFASEREAIVSDLAAVARCGRDTRDLVPARLRPAVSAMVAAFPVYRTYLSDAVAPPGQDGWNPEDVALLDQVLEETGARLGSAGGEACAFIRAVLLDDGPVARRSPELAARARRRFQQLTGPVMAKGLEDTLFYRHVRLLALNEVGGDPASFGVGLEKFHAAMGERARDWPHAMTGTATHDTKRGEDARSRLLALAEEHQAWADAFAETERLTSDLMGGGAPDANDRWMLLQSILGAWPVELLEQDDRKQLTSFRERLERYAEKALRESKRRSSWIDPDLEYEAKAKAWLGSVVAPKSPALAALRPLAQRLARRGALISLARTALKCCVPGVPDFYQGTDFWDLSLVDPDNRRPVDYRARAKALARPEPLRDLLEDWPDGRVKQALIRALLADRAAAPDLYASGDYEAITAEGPQADHVLAFGRANDGERLVLAVQRLTGLLLGPGELTPRRAAWAGTSLVLPEAKWRDVISGEPLQTSGKPIPVAELFSRFPIALLRASP